MEPSALIVCEAVSRGALAAVRSLGRSGWRVGVATFGGRGLAAASRYVSERHAIASPDDAESFRRSVAEAVASGDYQAILPAGDDELVALAHGPEHLRALAAIPGPDVVARALDKLELARVATEVGLRAPITTTEPPDEGPMVVKPRRAGLGGLRVPTRVFDARAEAISAAQHMSELGIEPIFQPVASGPLLAYAAVVDRQGRHRCRVMQRADRLWPTPAGISARARTVDIEPRLAERCEALLARLGWTGLVQLQFADTADGPTLLDLNGRLYGSLALAVAAGAPLPLAAAQDATGMEPPSADARPGVVYQWLYGDLRRALVERRHGVVRDVGGTLATARGSAHSVWSSSDRRPAARYLAGLLRRARAGRRQ